MSVQANPGFGGEPDYFCWLLSRAMPWSGGRAVVLEAYYDASERKNSGIFCVAGFAFGADRAKKATSSWLRLWGQTPCHMTDLSASPPKGAFKDWPDEKTKEFIEASIPIINRTASFGVAVSLDMADISAFAPKNGDPGSRDLLAGFRTAYAVCCHFAMASLSKMCGDSEIAYFFEQGDLYQNESQLFIRHISRMGGGAARRLYKIRSHTVLAKQDSRLFEMSDIFAWEWAKHVERDRARSPLDENGVTRMRGSLTALLGSGIAKSSETDLQSRTRRCLHIRRDRLERYFWKAEKLEVFKDAPSEQALAVMRALAAQQPS